MNDLALPDHGLRDAADVDSLFDVGNIQLHVQRDFVGAVHLGSDVHIHAHIQVLKRAVQRAGPRGSRSLAEHGLKAAGGIGDPIADLQARLHVINGANLRRLEDAGVAVGHEGFQRGPRQRYREIVGGERTQLAHVDRTRGGSGARRRESRCDTEPVGGSRNQAGAQVAGLGPVDLHHDDVHHYLSLGPVEIADQHLDQGHLVGRAPHDHRVQRGDGRGPHGHHELPESVDDVRQILLRAGVGDIENSGDLLFVLRAFGLRVLGDEDGVGRDRFPEGPIHHGHVVQGLPERGARQFQALRLEALLRGGEVRVKEHVDPGQLADGLKHDPGRLVVDLQVLRQRGERLQLWDGHHRSESPVRVAPRGGRGGEGALFGREV